MSSNAPNAPKSTGLACPRCGCRHLPVIRTKPRDDGTIVRERQCRHCGKRLKSIEKPIDGC